MPQPSTPPSSSPPSPTDPKHFALRTPLKLSRGRHPNIVPLTPQSLVAPRTPSDSKYTENSLTPVTLNRKPSIRTFNWRIREESPARDTYGDNQHEKDTLAPTTPSKLAGPFTPQVIKQARSPLDSNASKVLPNSFNLRGSFTDPPPRRRASRPQLNDEEYLNSDSTIEIDQKKSVKKDARHPVSPTLGRTTSQPASTCASCGGTERLSLLQPCQHQICASCVTGSLNVVGEKDMICMFCLAPIQSFKISRPLGRIHSGISTQPSNRSPALQQGVPFQDAPIPFDPFPQAPSCSDMEASPVIPPVINAPNAVLRIDNAPWDVTPPMIEQWLGNPTHICHVLLDRVDGRTLSHAYVETTADNARLALRTHQNKILGYGRRARAVTITLSSQEELMHALFPSWPGKFEGSRPAYETSLVDRQPPPPTNLLTSAELGIILHLIQSPKSHFLKVPSLAYWSLLSILVKIPAPDVFAPGTVPDVLFDITTFALEKYESQVGSQDYDPVLHMKLIDGAIHCKAFTDRQLSHLLHFTNRPPPVMQPYASGPGAPLIIHNNRPPPVSTSISQRWHEGTGLDRGPFVTMDACEHVARDFGLDSALVHALAERLVLHSSTTYRHY